MTTEEILKGLSGFIAVIGNARMTTLRGAEINKFDNVIRLNNFQTIGFEFLVGNKTTLWCTHGNLRDIVPRVQISQVISPFPATGPETVNQINQPIIYAETSPQDSIGINRPSTGGALLALFNHLKIHVTAYGFDFMETGHYFQENHHHNQFAHKQMAIEEEHIVTSEYVKVMPL